VYVQAIETFPRSIYNCRSMVIHEGYLIYAIGRHVYRLGGVSASGQGAKMEITPGPTSDNFPYDTIQHWDSFTVSNGYLFAIGYDANELGYVFCYNGAGWHRLYQTDNDHADVGYPVGLNSSQSSSNVPTIHWAQCMEVIGGSAFYEFYVSARLGAESPGLGTSVQHRSTGWFETSWMSFGLPLVPKLFRLIRIDAEDVSDDCRIKVEYTVHTGQEEISGTLGVMVQSDANFLMFPAGTMGTKLKLKFTLLRNEGQTPIIRRVVVQYMDRPDPVWGYSLTLDLSSPSRTQSSTSTGYTVEALKQHLRNCRAKESYVRFIDIDGSESDVMVSSGPRFVKVREKPAALITLMVVKRYLNTPGVAGVGTSAA